MDSDINMDDLKYELQVETTSKYPLDSDSPVVKRVFTVCIWAEFEYEALAKFFDNPTKYIRDFPDDVVEMRVVEVQEIEVERRWYSVLYDGYRRVFAESEEDAVRLVKKHVFDCDNVRIGYRRGYHEEAQ